MPFGVAAQGNVLPDATSDGCGDLSCTSLGAESHPSIGTAEATESCLRHWTASPLG